MNEVGASSGASSIESEQLRARSQEQSQQSAAQRTERSQEEQQSQQVEQREQPQETGDGRRNLAVA